MRDNYQIFKQEFYPYRPKLLYYAWQLTHDEEAAKDLVQDTFTNAFRFCDRYEPGTNAGPWLFQIMRNQFINKYRLEQRSGIKVEVDTFLRTEESLVSATTVSDKGPILDDVVFSDELSLALSQIPAIMRHTLLLYEVFGFTFEEISKIDQAPLGTVRTRAFHGRDKLREAYLRIKAKRSYRGNN